MDDTRTDRFGAGRSEAESADVTSLRHDAHLAAVLVYKQYVTFEVDVTDDRSLVLVTLLSFRRSKRLPRRTVDLPGEHSLDVVRTSGDELTVCNERRLCIVFRKERFGHVTFRP